MTDAHVHDHLDDHATTSTTAPAAGELPVVPRGTISNRRHFERFSCDVRSEDSLDLETPDRVEPDVSFYREMHSGADVEMPDGRRVRFWGFEDPRRGPKDPFPSPMIRVREGQVVHTTLNASKNTHTIHHHGIEPTPHNDGVGHTSFEVKDLYTYQWRPAHSGTFFYHCHKNTVLHFEMGMYGPLVVDPPEGEGFVRHGLDVVPYDHEVLWIPDDVDPDWHVLDHSAGLDCAGRHGNEMRHFRPRYWLLNGVPHPRTRTDRRTTVTCAVGERVLVRLLNAAYGPVSLQLPFDAVCVGADGHSLGGPGCERYSRPYTIPAGRTIELSTAQRIDLLVVPDRAGTFTIAMDLKHWVRGTPQGRVETTFTVTG